MSRNTINSTNCQNTTNSHNSTTTNNVSNYYTVGDDLSPLLKWLSPLDPGLRHSDIQERRVGSVGEWLMATEEFKRWCGLGGEAADKAVLFCYGNPGVGKTFISSLVVDKLSEQTGEQHTAVTCFYFDFAAQKEQTATSMLGSILKQVISETKKVPEVIWRALLAQKMAVSGRKPQLANIVKILQLITSSQPTFMVIDALDECTAPQRFRLFDSLKEILEKSPAARIFVTGRPHICPEIEARLAGRVTSVSIGPARDDIVGFLRVRLSEDETPDAMDSSLEAEILEKIPGSISDMFLLASLNIQAILQESTIYRRRERLSKMSDGSRLEDVYGATIERIKAQDGDKSRLGMGALMWISYAEEPLGSDVLCPALGIELGSTGFNAGNIPSISTLVSCCQGLITVDKEASKVRLIHFTLKEYFSAHPDIFPTPHSAMAEICLTYLNSEHVKALSANPLPTNLITLVYGRPFLRYCSLYWGVHAKKELSDHSRSLALQLLQEYDSHISAELLPRSEQLSGWLSSRSAFPLSGLDCASSFGIVEIVVDLINMGCCKSSRANFQKRTPLTWAARKGHEEVVKILLGQDEIGPDRPDNGGRTPLSDAVAEGHEGVVKILLGRKEVDPDRPDDRGRTPLSHGASNGREGVVKILLGREEVNPNRPDDRGQTPLSRAAVRGCEAGVKILLEREEVGPDNPANDGRTPLSYAAGEGHEGVVKMLLCREEVNPERLDNSGRTPLSYATEKGREEVVKILLEREEVDPGKPDNNGRTPLLHTAWAGNEGMVKILLGREEVNPDQPDSYGRTLLSYAAERGHEKVVRRLLCQEEVNPGKPDINGRTPLSHAAEGWQDMYYTQRVSTEVVQILLGREQVNPNEPGNDGRTPLSYAARWGHMGVVEALLCRGDINPEQPDNNGRTPLSYAAWGSWGVAQVLLRREEVNPDQPDSYGRTPLSYAAEWRNEKVVRMLLCREEINPERPDSNGRTPLSYAAEGVYGTSSKEVVQSLLGREQVNPEKPDNDGRTPLSYAAENKCEGAVRILLEQEEVNPDKPDNHGRTPLSHAAKKGREETMQILLGRGEVNPDKPDNSGRTPLSYAAEWERNLVIDRLLRREEDNNRNSYIAREIRQPRATEQAEQEYKEVVKMLLGQEQVNPDKPDTDGRTPLSHAAKKGNEEMMQILLGREEVNPDKPDNNGRTPLSHAAESMCEGAVKILLGREQVNPEQSDNDGKTPLMWAPSSWHQDMEALLQPYKAVPHSAVGYLGDTTSRKAPSFLLFPTILLMGLVLAYLLL